MHHPCRSQRRTNGRHALASAGCPALSACGPGVSCADACRQKAAKLVCTRASARHPLCPAPAVPHPCRRKLLRARGWRVVSVPFYHWSGEEGGAPWSAELDTPPKRRPGFDCPVCAGADPCPLSQLGEPASAAVPPPQQPPRPPPPLQQLAIEDGRRALLQRIVAEARALPVPAVAPEHAAATARLQQLQASFQHRLPAWRAEEERRTAALARQREEAEAVAAAEVCAAAYTPGPGSGVPTEGPAPASSTAAAAPAPASSAAVQQVVPAAAQPPTVAGAAAGQEVPQQEARVPSPLLQQEQVPPLDAPTTAPPLAEMPAPKAPEQPPPLPPSATQHAEQAQQARREGPSPAPVQQQLPAAGGPGKPDTAAAQEQELLAAKEAALRLVESLSPRVEHAQDWPGPMLPPGFGPPAGAQGQTPGGSPLRTPRALPPPQDEVPTPLLPPGLGAAHTPGPLAGAPSEAALAAAQAAARALSGARAPLFLGAVAPASRPQPPSQQPLGRSGGSGIGSSDAALGGAATRGGGCP